MSEHAVYFRPAPGIEALEARFVDHAYLPLLAQPTTERDIVGVALRAVLRGLNRHP